MNTVALQTDISDYSRMVKQLILECHLEDKLQSQINEGIIAGPERFTEYIDVVLMESIRSGIDPSDQRVSELLLHTAKDLLNLESDAVQKSIAINISAISAACCVEVSTIEFESGLHPGFTASMKEKGGARANAEVLLSLAYVCGVPMYVIAYDYGDFTDLGMLWTELTSRDLVPIPTSTKSKEKGE